MQECLEAPCQIPEPWSYVARLALEIEGLPHL